MAFLVTRRNVSEHQYKDGGDIDDEGTFEVYQTDEGWWWSFSPVWKDCGPFQTRPAAILAGEMFVDENGKPYIE